MTARLTLRKRFFWVLTGVAAWYYLVMIVTIFIAEQAAQAAGAQGGEGFTQFLAGLVWHDQMLIGFSYGQLVFMAGALFAGAGVIANDNRANALLVYLSKPCTKFDYLFGKWMGVFLPMAAMIGLPSMAFYLYGVLSYRPYGFISQNPTMGLRMLLVIALAAALHASLIVGVSSLFNQGRLAGATYAGFYLITYLFTAMMAGVWQVAAHGGDEATQRVLEYLFYFSIDGVNIALAKNILGTDGAPPFGFAGPGAAAIVPAPPVLPFLAAFALLSLGFLWIAWSRIRAVEVVR
jgi:ABC-2 type transport system permease protein